MRILSIESSCDETSLAILEVDFTHETQTFKVLAHNTHSQIDVHQEFGGVFPALAKREHQKNMIPLFMKTLKDVDQLIPHSTELSETTLSTVEKILNREPELATFFIEFLNTYELPKFDAIAVTVGPGLEPTLWVGINFAKVLAVLTDTPLIPVNHMEGHILSVATKGQETFTLPDIAFPALSLLISGGHTELVLMRAWGDYEVIGKTLDDAVGEAFDKVARLIGLPYPGGPEISKLAELARENTTPKTFTLPRPMLHSKDLNFSFSGLKTAVLYATQGKELTEDERLDLCREFEDSVTEVLIKKTKNAVHEHGIETLIMGGGVSANTHIQKAFTQWCESENIALHIPSKEVTGDNALMIGIAGVLSYNKKTALIPLDEIKAVGTLLF
jgi:N6-L-threonylcarbamoyladenine synthase